MMWYFIFFSLRYHNYGLPCIAAHMILAHELSSVKYGSRL